MDAYSTDYSPRIQINTSRTFLNLWTQLTLTVKIRKERACVYFNFPYAIKLAIGLNAFQQDPSLHRRILLLDSLLSSFHREGPQTSQRYPHVPTTSWRISIRNMDSFQGLTPKSPSSWHRSLAPNKYVESLELGKNGSAFVQGETPTKMGDPGLFTLPCRLGDSKPFDTLADLGSCVNIIPLYLFKKLNIGLLEETDHIFGLADGTKSYPVGIVKDVEVHIGKLKLLNDFYVLDMKKDPETPLLVGRGFLATANVIIDCRMAKIAVGEGITRSVFSAKGIDLGEEEAPYWTTLVKRESYKPQPSMDEIGAKPPYYARKDFLDCHLPREWEISRDVELNPFKDNLVFRRMDKPPKNGNGAWHAKIRLIDPDGEEFTKTLQSIPTTRKLSERESLREIIDLDHFYDT
ncbi:MAK10-like protein [Tanacetum coccineum]